MTEFQVHAQVYTLVGKFTGYVSMKRPTLEEATAERDEIQKMLSDCKSFTFFSDRNPGSEITLNRSVIDNSVFMFTVHKNPTTDELKQ